MLGLLMCLTDMHASLVPAKRDLALQVWPLAGGPCETCFLDSPCLYLSFADFGSQSHGAASPTSSYFFFFLIKHTRTHFLYKIEVSVISPFMFVPILTPFNLAWMLMWT